MNVFQILVIPFLALLFLRSVVRIVRSRRFRPATVIGAVIWLSAAVAVLHPQLTIRVARAMGIGRGADLILYILVLAYLLTVFYFYNKTLHLEAALTKVVRQLSLQQPVDCGRAAPPSEPAADTPRASAECAGKH